MGKHGLVLMRGRVRCTSDKHRRAVRDLGKAALLMARESGSHSGSGLQRLVMRESGPFGVMVVVYTVVVVAELLMAPASAMMMVVVVVVRASVRVMEGRKGQRPVRRGLGGRRGVV